MNRLRPIPFFVISIYVGLGNILEWVSVCVWNTLPDTVVSANTIDTFKARLFRFWSDQNVKYNWKSDIITGSRSQVSVIIE